MIRIDCAQNHYFCTIDEPEFWAKNDLVNSADPDQTAVCPFFHGDYHDCMCYKLMTSLLIKERHRYEFLNRKINAISQIKIFFSLHQMKDTYSDTK